MAALAIATLPAIAAPAPAPAPTPTSAPEQARISAIDAAALVAISAPAPVMDAVALPDRALMFAANINQFVAMQPDAAPTPRNADVSRIQSVLRRALALLGTPYRWGGTSPENGFDCSGLVDYVFHAALGIDLPRVSREQAKAGTAVTDRSHLSAGDLVFFGRRGRVDHVGIYVGEGKFVHAPRTGKDVRVSTMDSGYWDSKFLEARRIAM